MEMALRAERELERYKATSVDDMTTKNLLFMLEVNGWKPNGPHQIFWMDALHRNKNTLQKAPKRCGKTMSAEAVDLYDLAVNPKEDLCVYAPKLSQCRELLSYHYDWIDKSPLLKAFLRLKNGKPIFSSENYQFANMSSAKCFSIQGNIEAVNVSIARLEEFDDWPWLKFANELMGRLGAAAKNEKGKRIRITGAVQGEENFYAIQKHPALRELFVDLSEHPVYGTIDVHLLLAMGTVFDEAAVEVQRKTMTKDEWARCMLLKYTEARNFIMQRYMRAVIKKSMEWGLQGEIYIPKERYVRKPGTTLSVGLDCGHGGDDPTSSKFSLQFEESINVGNVTYKRWINGFEWAGTTDTARLEREICDRIEYYRPDGGYGDALGMQLISGINAELYRRGVTNINIADFPENKPGNWVNWYLIPLWNNDVTKYEMYNGLRTGIEKQTTFFPYYDDKDDSPEAEMCRLLIKQLTGIKEKKTKAKVPSYHAESAKLGDDHADAMGMADKWLNDHDPGYIDWHQVKINDDNRVFSSASILSSLNR